MLRQMLRLQSLITSLPIDDVHPREVPRELRDREGASTQLLVDHEGRIEAAGRG
jgi:hypothetical protein